MKTGPFKACVVSGKVVGRTRLVGTWRETKASPLLLMFGLGGKEATFLF